MTWFLQDLARFNKEKEEIEQLQADVDWLSATFRLVSDKLAVDFNIELFGEVFSGRLTYPYLFPDTPAYIKPLSSDERWSSHQYGHGGSLCLEWRADNWQTDVTGADLIRSAHRLLSSEKKPDNPVTVPDAHSLTMGQQLRSSFSRLLITQELTQALSHAPEKGILEILLSYSEDAFVYYVSKTPSSEGSLEFVQGLPTATQGKLTPWCFWKGNGYYFKSDNFNLDTKIESHDDLKLVIEKAGYSLEEVLQESEKRPDTIMLIGSNGDSIRAFKVFSDESQKLSEMRIINEPPFENRLPEDSYDLKNTRVGIIGLGSVGSKVAISLARSGVNNFYLVDDDILMPGNLVRNELAFPSVGHHKVEATKCTLELINSDIKVITAKNRIHGQESAVVSENVLNSLSKCDLLIDASANPEVFLVISSIARKKRIPLCWAEVFAGGYGGLIARSHPDLDPPPHRVRDGLHTYLSKQPEAPYKSAQGYDNDFDQPHIAHDADVTFIASSLTRLVLDSASKRFSKEHKEPLYLIGMKKDWIFTGPFDTRPISLEYESWDEPVSNATQEEIDRSVNQLLELIKAAE